MIRTVTADDMALARELWRAFEEEVPDAPWRDADADDDLVRADLVLLADEAGLAVASKRGARMWFLELVYVRPAERSKGVGRDLLRAVAEHVRADGADVLELEVLETNERARRLYESLGFATVERTLAAPVGRLLALEEDGPTFGRVHVQTDDVDAVTRDVGKVLPRLGRGSTPEISETSGSWVSVRSDVTDADPAKLKALAKELSYLNGGVTLALGVEHGAVVRYTMYDRGSMVDEYASVPEYDGPLAPGDVIALGANPTVVARLTGADPQRVREVMRSAASPAELPPAGELYRQVAGVLGVEVD